jgi:glycosyltransferase involved in cell wall biosynthesis
MSDNIILSICILVRNQEKDVERLLNKLVPQLKDGVEIVIRDGGNNNENQNYIRKYFECKQVKYFSRPNEEIDEKIILVTKEARGKFVWWMGDDDVVEDGVEAVLRIIKQHQCVTFIWANYVLFNTKKYGINLLHDRLFASRDEILKHSGAGLGFVSSTIFRRDLALTGVEAAQRYMGSGFLSLYLVLHVLSQSGDHYYIHGPVVICHPTSSEEIIKIKVLHDGTICNQAFEVFGINFHDIIRHYSAYFLPNTIRQTLKKSFGQTWRGIMVGWIGGWDTPKGKRIRLLRYFWMFPEAWVASILFLIPLPINKLLYQAYKSLFRRVR